MYTICRNLLPRLYQPRFWNFMVVFLNFVISLVFVDVCFFTHFSVNHNYAMLKLPLLCWTSLSSYSANEENVYLQKAKEGFLGVGIIGGRK